MSKARPDRPPARLDEDSWAGRPVLAWSIRAFVFGGPLLASLLVTTAATRWWAAPRATSSRVLWWAALLLLATATVWLVDRVLRRLMPLAALLEMSVVFPGRAPTRFSVARQSGSTRHLEELVARARESDAQTEPVIAAGRILALVGALRSHDRATRGHSERVRVLTDMVAEEMGLAQADRDRLRWAALLHDIGKLDVPAAILNKPGRPNQQEWERLKTHPAAGEALVGPLLEWLGAFAPVIVQHHERWDGLGYPRGLAGTQICVGARIVALADAFEVMTAARSYKKAMPRPAALREVARKSGAQFDPAAVRALLSISAPRLRWALGPGAWLAQIPVIGSAPSLASAAGVAGQAAAGAGAVGIGTAVGLTNLTPHHVPGEISPQVISTVVAPHVSPSAVPAPRRSATVAPTSVHAVQTRAPRPARTHAPPATHSVRVPVSKPTRATAPHGNARNKATPAPAASAAPTPARHGKPSPKPRKK